MCLLLIVCCDQTLTHPHPIFFVPIFPTWPHAHITSACCNQPRAFVRSVSPLWQSTPGSDQCFFSRSLVVRRAEPLGAIGSHARSNSLSLSAQKWADKHFQLKPLPPATPIILHQIWSSHLAFRRLASHSVPRVPEAAGGRGLGDGGWGWDKERLFPDCWRESERRIKKRERGAFWNI